MFILLFVFGILVQAVPVFAVSAAPVSTVMLEIIEDQIHKRDLTDTDIANLQRADQVLLVDYARAIMLIQDGYFGQGYDKLVEVERALLQDPHPDLEMAVIEKKLQINEVFANQSALLKNGLRLRALGRDHERSDMVAYADIFIANAYYEQSDLASAMDLLKEAGFFGRELKNDGVLSRYYYFLSAIQNDLEAYPLAKQYMELALKYAEEKNSQGLIYIPKNVIKAEIAVLDASLGDYESASASMEALNANVPPNRRAEAAIYLYYQAEMELKAKHYDHAIQAANEGLAIIKTLESPNDSNSLSQVMNPLLAAAYYLDGQYEEAARMYYGINTMIAEDLVLENVEVADALTTFENLQFQEEMDYVEALRAAQNDKINLQQRNLMYLAVMVVLLILCLVFISVGYRIRSKSEKSLFLQSITDHLTQVPNRNRIIELFEETKCNGGVVMLMDVDDFKKINDQFGHVVGDDVLKVIAQTIQSAIRDTDHVGRYGGEEFLVVLNGCDLETGVLIGERIRSSIENLNWQYLGMKTTVSIGLMSTRCDNTDMLLHDVDMLMYKAKKSGKNKIVMQ